MIRKATLAAFLAAVMFTTACHKTTTVTTPVTPVPLDQRIMQYVQILATANENAANVVVSLHTAGILNDAQTTEVATYQTAIAKATAGVSQILAVQPGVWTYDKAIQIQNLGLSLVPPANYKSFGVSTNVQFQALVTALNACESTIKIIIQMSVPPTAGAPPATK
jgi:hypothetical protein